MPTALLLIFPFPASAGSPGCGEPQGRFSCLGSKGTSDVACSPLPLLSNIYQPGNKWTRFWVPCRGWCHVLAAGRGVPAVPHGTAPHSAPAQSHRDGIAPAPSSACRSEVTWGWCHPLPCLSFPPGLSQELLTPTAAASTEDTASQRAAKPAPDDGRAMPRWHVARGETSLSIPAARRAIPTSGTSCPSHHTDPNPPCPQLFAAPQLSEVINNRD